MQEGQAPQEGCPLRYTGSALTKGGSRRNFCRRQQTGRFYIDISSIRKRRSRKRQTFRLSAYLRALSIACLAGIRTEKPPARVERREERFSPPTCWESRANIVDWMEKIYQVRTCITGMYNRHIPGMYLQHTVTNTHLTGEPYRHADLQASGDEVEQRGPPQDFSVLDPQLPLSLLVLLRVLPQRKKQNKQRYTRRKVASQGSSLCTMTYIYPWGCLSLYQSHL